MSAEIRSLDLTVNGVPMVLRFADCWDPPDDDEDRITVYYEDEDRPANAIPLYRLEAR